MTNYEPSSYISKKLLVSVEDIDSVYVKMSFDIHKE